MSPLSITRPIARLLLLWLLLAHIHAGHSATPDLEPVQIGGERFELELALDAITRARGLMFRESIDADGGMLFVFPDDARRNFWMKNCLVDMDILFLDRNGVIVRIHEMFAEPLQQANESMQDYHARLKRYPSSAPARYAIELRHGTARRLGIIPGQRIELDARRLMSLAS
jgi:uncharacterized protein